MPSQLSFSYRFSITKNIKTMKSIQRSLLITLVPLLTPITAFAEKEKQAELSYPVAGARGNAASWRASQVIGLNVNNAADETMGEVEDLVLDMKSGDILAVIISSGGFLGLSDTLSAVPVTALRYDSASKAFKTKLTKQQLGKAPQFKTDAWPNYNEATSIDALRSYRDSIGGDVNAPDNSAQNDRESNQNTTPTDQGNSEKDIQITKDIRSGIMDMDLSFNAKNIKIITSNEYVSLKGVVESDAEHQTVLKIARNHANTAKINDDLKVNDK
jgi:sporulation protein YlmC with PRC-barrel domain